MTNKDRYNKISKHMFMLALLPQSAYLFEYTCKLLSKGIMRASTEPVDVNLTSWPWFKAGVAILKQPLFDDAAVSSPDDLNVSEWACDKMLKGFAQLVKSLRWYIQRLEQHYWADWKEEDGPPPDIEMLSSSGYAILANIIYQIDGGYLAPEGDRINAHVPKKLLFYDNKAVGIQEFRPWALKDLYEDCDKKIDLHRVPWGTLLDHRVTFRGWYESYLYEPQTNEDDLESYLDMLETHLPDISEEGWFEGYSLDEETKSAPPPAPKVTEVSQKAEKKGMRFEVKENEPEGCTTYHDQILDTTYVISNRTKAKKIIDSFMIDPLQKGVKQWNTEWKNYKGAFQRPDGSFFNCDQIIHEAKPNFMGEETEQYTGRWRIRTDEEMSVWAQKHSAAKKSTEQM